MANPIKNNQVPPQDPYANSYGKGGPDPYAKNHGTGGPAPDPYGEYGYDPGMGGDEYGMDGGYDDEFVGGDFEEGPQGPQPELTTQGLRDMANELKDKLGDQYKTFWGRINATTGMSPEKAQAELAKIAAEMNNIAFPPETGVEGMEGEDMDDDGSKTLKAELETFKKAIQDNTDLSSEQKSEYLEKLDKWIKGMELGTITVESAQENLEALKQEVSDATAFPPIFQKLGELTGKSPQELEALFSKHGLDPKNLPSPPDGAVAKLLNDPEFSSTLQTLKGSVKDAYTALKEKIDAKIAECNSRNDQARSNSSVTNDNFQPFRDIQDIFEHKDDLSKALVSERKKLADEVATLLSAMYGTSVTAITDGAKAGCVNFNGTELNVMQTSSTGDIAFSNETKVDYPSFERPTFWKDCEGDGAIAAPSWMSAAEYPAASYDGSFEWGYSS